jgi:hypothetical protein
VQRLRRGAPPRVEIELLALLVQVQYLIQIPATHTNKKYVSDSISSSAWKKR